MMRVDPQQLEKAIFLGMGVERFTQDSPILPDVWAEYGQKPNERIDLLLNPYKDESPGRLCEVLLKRLGDRAKDPNRYRMPTSGGEGGGQGGGGQPVHRRHPALLRRAGLRGAPDDALVERVCLEGQCREGEEQKIKLFLANKKGVQEEMVEFMQRYPLERDESAGGAA